MSRCRFAFRVDRVETAFRLNGCRVPTLLVLSSVRGGWLPPPVHRRYFVAAQSRLQTCLVRKDLILALTLKRPADPVGYPDCDDVFNHYYLGDGYCGKYVGAQWRSTPSCL